MKYIQPLITVLTFAISFIIYIMTMAPTTSFWDCGEFIATSIIMGVPHPPGTPLYLILGNVFSQLPFFADLGARVNFISVIVSAFAVMFLYLICVALIEEWRGKTESISDMIINYGSAFIAAMTFAVTDSHWFNAVEAEVYSISTFFTGIVVWLILKWSRNEGQPGNVKYILLIAYMLGLATGIHLLNLLALPFIALIIYFKKYDYSHQGFVTTVGVTLLSFLVIYLGIIKGIPNMANDYGLGTPILIILLFFAVTIYAIYAGRHRWSTILGCFALVLIGFSTYSTIFIRATQHPNINENNPDTITGALAYMNRDQYGDWSITDRSSTMKRPENAYWNRYTSNRNNPSKGEVRSFVWNYQIKEMYLRYFLWQFAGKESFAERSWEVKSLDSKLIKKLQGIDWFRYGIPLALLFGLAGMGHHFYRDPKRALALLSLFLATGLMIIIYLNQYDPQPRERDYSYVGSFFAFSIWISIGIAGLLERLKEFTPQQVTKYIQAGIIGVLIIAMPFNMVMKDFREHDRTGNYVAWDYAYNILNSCEPNGIIFTNGDNDTFPLWYIQEVEGIRKDVRVVNLSLLNTPWYIEQLKNQKPTIPLDLTDSQIPKIDPVTGTAHALQKWTNEWIGMKAQMNQYFRENVGVTYNVREHGIPIRWSDVDAEITLYNEPIQLKLKPSISNYLRVQDYMVLEILDDVGPDRPVYFAVTVSPNNRLGMDSYLEMEGLVFRITSTKNSDRGSSARLNYDRMVNYITETDTPDFIVHSIDDFKQQLAENKGLYRYTNLDNPDVYFNSNVQRLIQNYRSGFLQLALEDLYSSRPDGKGRSLALLRKMDEYFPPHIIPVMEPDLDIQIGRIYAQAGDKDQLKLRLETLSTRPDVDMETQFYIGQVYVNELSDYDSAIGLYQSMKDDYPFVADVRFALVQAYSQTDRFKEAIQELEEWLILSPQDEKAKELLSLLRTRT